MKKEDFLRVYSTYSTADLLKIVLQKEHYQAIAIEAAEDILSKRNITDHDHDYASQSIIAEQEKQKRTKEKVEKLKTTATKFVDEHFDLEVKTPSKKLNIFCMVMTVLFLYQLISFSKSFYIFRYEKILFVLALIELLLAGLMIFLIYKRKNAGWMIGVVYSIVTSVTILYSLLFDFLFVKENPYLPFDLYDPRPQAYSLFVKLLIFIAILYFLNHRTTRELFPMKKNTRLDALIIGVIFSFVAVVYLYLQ